MIDDATSTRIRRLFFAEHWRIGTIVSELGVHRDAVERIVRVDSFRPAGGRTLGPLLVDPYKSFIAEVLEQHPRLRATRLFEMIRGRGYSGSVVQLRRYVRTVRPRKAEAYLRRRTLPGEEAQVDWGHFGSIRIGAARRTLSCFVLVLGYSRAMYARFFLDQTTASFLCGHRLAFAALGGVPRRILYDNLKSAVVERVGDHIRFGELLLGMADHYRFEPRPCAPYRGNEKGKVERGIRYLRDAFFPARTFGTVEELNAQLATWIETVAHKRAAPGDPERRPVQELLALEQPLLLPLGGEPFPCDLVRPCASGKTPYIRFDSNDYSIPHHLVTKPLTLVASEHEVRIENSGGLVFARHRRSYDRGQIIEDPAHIDALAQEKRRAHEIRGRDRLRAACSATDELLTALLSRNQSLGVHVRRLLHLLDLHGPRPLEEAMRAALREGAPSSLSIAHQLDAKRREAGLPPPLPPPTSPPVARGANRAVSEAAVLSAYDGLAHAPRSRASTNNGENQ